MAPYFLILMVPALPAIFVNRRVGAFVFWFACLVFVLFVGARHHVGMDWNNYLYIHEALAGDRLLDVLFDKEPASHGLFWLSMYLNDDMLLSNLVAAGILLGGVFAFAMRTANPWLAVVAAAPYLVIAFGMTGIRQAMGIGISLYLLSIWETSSLMKRGIIVIIASTFHTSAIIIGLLIVSQLKLPMIVRGVILVVGGAAAYFVASRIDTFQGNIDFYQDVYLSSDEQIESAGALFHVALVWIPAIVYLLFRRYIKPYLFDVRLMDFGAIATIMVLLMYFVSSTAASRLTLYLYFVPMLLYPAIVCVYGERHRTLLTTLVVLVHFGILAGWMNFANNASAHIPYRTIFTDDQRDFQF